MLIAACLAAAAAWLAWPSPRHAGDGPDVVAALRAWQRARAAPRRADRAPVLAALAAELSAGAGLDAALVATPGAFERWPTAWRAAQAGGDVAAAFEADGADALAACWRVAGASGAGLARAMSGMAAYERQATAVRDQLDAELAAARASARMLAALPLVGIGMGVLMGADPAGFLTHGIGVLCLVAALALVGVGLAWSARIARGVERLL